MGHTQYIVLTVTITIQIFHAFPFQPAPLTEGSCRVFETEG
jgi:hypothetical protein